jgi:ABC-type uncharacterized transport system permease subunit
VISESFNAQIAPAYVGHTKGCAIHVKSLLAFALSSAALRSCFMLLWNDFNLHRAKIEVSHNNYPSYT